MNRLEVAENWAESQDASLLMLGGTPEERQSFADAFLGVMYMGDRMRKVIIFLLIYTVRKV